MCLVNHKTWYFVYNSIEHFQYEESMTPEEFTKLKILIEKDCLLDDSNMLQMSTKYPSLYQKYLNIYLRELDILKTMKTELENLYGVLLKKFKYEDHYKWDTKSEIESQISGDTKYHEKRLLIVKQEYVVEYLEKTLDNIQRISFSIKNWVEIKKFMMGMG